METIHIIFASAAHLILNWTTYFWSVPVFMVVFGLLDKATSERQSIRIGDLATYLILGLINPVWYFAMAIIIFLIPTSIACYLVYAGWKKVNDIEII